MKTLSLKILAFICIVLGIIGIPTPILPTTPFLLAAAFLFLKSDPVLYQKLIHHKYLGTYIQNYREHKYIPLKTKIISLILLWGGIGYSILGLPTALWLKIVLLCIALGVSIHILSLKSQKTTKKNRISQNKL
ncbi:MAG: YbaN family protein [Bacteroidales bacterium]